MLTLGWKPSAEQFAPADLLRYGVLAEELGHFPGKDQERAMRLYAREILPRLRA